MSVRYYVSHGEVIPEYVCQKRSIERAEPVCQRILGAALDRALGDLLVETVSPLAIEVALAVQQELQARADETDRLRQQQVERARYEAELAQRRYLRVDPDNRLVADSLEADWNQKLRAVADAQEDYERQRQADDGLLDSQQRQEVASLATDFSRLWHDPATRQRDRKRMMRLLIEDITLLKADEVLAQVRFRGGATQTLRLTRPKPAVQLRQIDPAILHEIDRLLDAHTDREITEILNGRGLQPAVGYRFTPWIIWRLRIRHGLESRFSRLRRRGLLTLTEAASALHVHPATVQKRQARGELSSVVYNDKGQRLYALPSEPAMTSCARCGRPISVRGRGGQRQRFCSVTCRTGDYARRRQEAGWRRINRRWQLTTASSPIRS